MHHNNTRAAAWLPVGFLSAIIVLWQVVVSVGLVPQFLLPPPSKIISALVADRSLLLHHTLYTLAECFLGLASSVVLGTATAVLMDASPLLRRTIHPLLIFSQSVPTIAIAPLFVLWFGYGVLSKVLLITLTCYFPVAVNAAAGLSSVDKDEQDLFRSFGATKWQAFFLLKIPSAVSSFLVGLRLAVAYSFVAAVVSEWLGGNDGLGVYMIRVKKSYRYDKLFAAILIVSSLTLILTHIKLSSLLKKKIHQDKESQ